MKKVFLENLPRHKGTSGRINWKESIGYRVPFIYDDIEGEIEIINYDTGQELTTKYNQEFFKIKTQNFTGCMFGKMLGKITKDFKIEVGQIFKDDIRDITILFREYKKDVRHKEQKYYKYHCNKCGNEDWSIENHLLRGGGCNACCPTPRKAVLGINTIWDTDRWMVDLGVSEEDAKKYTHGSNKKITVKCPNCGRERNVKISTLNMNKSIACICSDGASYPEKIVANILEQIHIKYEIQYSPKWVGNKRYDFYIKECNCIIEVHGKQHYSLVANFSTKKGRTLEEEQANDKFKKETALNNGIKHYIELDCKYSNIKYIKNSILNSELNDLFDLSKVDWLKSAKFANVNKIKEVCDYWNNKKEEETTRDLSELFKVNKNTIREYLKKGTKLGWCNYNPLQTKKVNVIKNGIIVKSFNSLAELEQKSEKIFGTRLLHSKVSNVCNGKKPQYKGFTFKYIS